MGAWTHHGGQLLHFICRAAEQLLQALDLCIAVIQALLQCSCLHCMLIIWLQLCSEVSQLILELGLLYLGSLQCQPQALMLGPQERTCLACHLAVAFLPSIIHYLLLSTTAVHH